MRYSVVRTGRSAVPIETFCPNGHHLKTDDTNAGKTGKCPICKVPVTIPMPQRQTVSESTVVKILGQMNAADSRTVMAPLRNKPPVTPQPVSRLKACPNCERKIDFGYQICPHCQKQLTGLNDF
ncbi:MAG: hypothetical protein LBT89_04530 [Planctomycetaceae bacterium]|nr:hypothetical protein [Planctomycetaceae bacterium]